MTARLSHTAAELVGVTLHQLRVKANHPEQARHSFPGTGVSRLDTVGLDGLDDLLAHPVHRVQYIHCRLENYGDAAPPLQPHLFLGHKQDVLTVSQQHPARRQPGVIGQKAHQASGDRGFAATGLSHQPQRAAPGQFEADLTHGLYLPCLVR